MFYLSLGISLRSLLCTLFSPNSCRLTLLVNGIWPAAALSFTTDTDRPLLLGNASACIFSLTRKSTAESISVCPCAAEVRKWRHRCPRSSASFSPSVLPTRLHWARSVLLPTRAIGMFWIPLSLQQRTIFAWISFAESKLWRSVSE